MNTDVGADKVVAAQVTSPQRVYVTRTMTRIAPDGARLDGSATLPVAAPATTWGFPEGYTGVTFQEYLTLLNPTASPANVTILLAPQADSAQGQDPHPRRPRPEPHHGQHPRPQPGRRRQVGGHADHQR